MSFNFALAFSATRIGQKYMCWTMATTTEAPTPSLHIIRFDRGSKYNKSRKWKLCEQSRARLVVNGIKKNRAQTNIGNEFNKLLTTTSVSFFIKLLAEKSQQYPSHIINLTSKLQIHMPQFICYLIHAKNFSLSHRYV